MGARERESLFSSLASLLVARRRMRSTDSRTERERGRDATCYIPPPSHPLFLRLCALLVGGRMNE